MSGVVYGEPTIGAKTDFSRESYDYAYPDGLDLKPGSDFHDELKNQILQRARESRNIMSKRYDSWNEIDRVLTVYIDTDTAEKKVKQKDSRRPTSIVFPYSYVMLETLLTYLTMAFFQDPIFRFEGYTPEDKVGAMMLELVIQLHCIRNKVPLNLHTMFRDSLAYGIGTVAPDWMVKRGMRVRKTESATATASGEIIPGEGREFSEGILFEGNSLGNIDPYMFLPDPNVGAHEIQKGEYVGWAVRDNLMNLLAEERDGKEEGLFNVKYLRAVKNKKSTYLIDQSDREKKTGGGSMREQDTSTITNVVDKIYMYVNLVPKDWKLGHSEYPEKWLFTLAADEVIIEAEKIDYMHGLYPVNSIAPDFDGYSPTPLSKLEVLYGMQHTLDFLFNSHIANVRKAINDMLVVDPYLVNINDLKNPEPGKLIRLRRPAWGRGVDKVVQQLQVNDITRGNIADSAYIAQWMERVSAADQSMSGSLRQGGPERLTRSEFQGTRGSAVSRLQRIAMIIGWQGMQDLGYMFASHTQQFMNKDVYVSTVGRYQQTFEKMFGKDDRAKVTPFDLLIDYDVVVKDGSVPGGNFSDAWVQLFNIIGTNEQLAQQFDVVKIFTYIATQLGAKNVEDFKKDVSNMQTQTMSDENVSNEVEKGNLVSL